jgi:hypothetical protein
MFITVVLKNWLMARALLVLNFKGAFCGITR